MKSHTFARRWGGLILAVAAGYSLVLPSTIAQTALSKVPPDHAERMVKGQELFKQHVRAILTESCLKCHGGDKTKGDFDLSSRESLLRGAGGTKVVIPYHAKDSRLVTLIKHLAEPKMPYKLPKLSDAQIGHLAAWIDLGAPYDKPLVEKVAAKRAMTVTDEDRKFWSFLPLKRPPLPTPPKSPPSEGGEKGGWAWCKTPIDRFILAKLEEKQIAPNPLVDRRTLIRRVYLDLIGLPPPPEEVDAFVNDAKPLAYERLIDRLLTNPHFGERWARHWLDIARFAESSGYEHDYDRPFAYHYRDFVIKAFNSDLPYDKFVKWQIAGDEYEPDNPLAVMATGFLAAGTHSTQITANLVEKERYEQLDDKLRTLGTAMLGLTIGCARCHDHKYDPIPTRDYYRMLSTFTTTVKANVDINLDPVAYRKSKAAFDAEHAKVLEPVRRYPSRLVPERLAKWLSASLLPGPQSPQQVVRELVSWVTTQNPEWLKLAANVVAHKKLAPRPTVAKALIASEGVPPLRMHTQGADFFEQTYFLRRGDTDQKDGVVTQSFLQVLMRNPDQEKRWQAAPPPGWRTSYRRRALAEWLTDVEHGAGHLLARVIVNRLWQHHMGRGIVSTPSDFGVQGEPPTHPELLDWLAQELIDNGWSLRHIHKLILTSAIYQQTSNRDPKKVLADSENRYFWHKPRQRLQAEVIRDSMLAVSGTLDPRPFGPGTLYLGHKRRSIYFFVKRSKLVPTMLLFDAPDALQGMDRRPTTTIAPQALLLLNSIMVRGYAESFARRLDPRTDAALSEVVREGYRVALARPPSAAELKESVEFLQEQIASYQADRRENGRHLAVADFCQVLLSLNEFVYVD